ncbi:MAG: ABC transporter permease [Verrucomicrobiota bacterium]|nr:ABC transporter permease [Verrucomicrobiota bacterium]
MFSDLARTQFRKFKSIRRAWWSLWILAITFFLSLFSEHLANDRPLFIRYQERSYFPTLRFYSGQTFGGPYKTEANYRALREDPAFRKNGNWMLLPPIPHNPLHPYLDLAGEPPHKPSARHWLGTDEAARDVAARLLYGYRICMLFALSLTAIDALLGIAIGGLQGYFGGKIDLLAQRGIEIWSSLPILYVAILIGSIYGQGFATLLFVLALFYWIGLSYYMRGEFLRLKNMSYVWAARALGASHSRILAREILPNALTPAVTILPFRIVAGISALTALDFLGFGLPPPTPSWGELLKQGLDNYLQAPWLAITSVLALFITLLLASFVGEGARAAFDPKSMSHLQ